VGATGAPLDGNGFKIRPGSAIHGRLAPTVAANSNGWLVAWEDWRNIFLGTVPYPEIWSTQVSSNGTVATTENQITIATDQTKIACAPAAIWNGQRFFVAYEQPCTQSPIGLRGAVAGRWLSAAGVPGAGFVPIASGATASVSAPQVTTDVTGKIIVTWRSAEATAETINAGLISDNSNTVDSSAVIVDSPGKHQAPSVGYAVSSGSSGTLLFSWIDNNPVQVSAQRTDEKLNLIGGPSPFPIATVPTFTAVPPTTIPGTFTAGDQAASPRLSSPAAVSALPTGNALVSYNQLEVIGARSYPRMFMHALGLRGLGSPCSDASGCVVGFCTGGVCCDTPCDGICQACGANGCVNTPPSDARCNPGVSISCTSLSTTCRTFQDQPLNRCVSFGECAETASLDECTTFTNAPDNTACSSDACGSMGVCTAGDCGCMSEALPQSTVRMLTPAPPNGCSAAGGGDASSACLMLLGLLLLLGYRSRRREAARPY
jgi:MYXO-CTERM domain-containing protein